MIDRIIGRRRGYGDFHVERQKVSTTPIDLRRLTDRLVELEVEEVVMESTAQYWRPVWEALPADARVQPHWPPRAPMGHMRLDRDARLARGR